MRRRARSSSRTSSDSAVLKDVHDGQVHTLSSNPGLTVDDALEATVAPDPPMEVTYQIVEIMEQRALSIAESEEPPTVHERELATETETGELAREERAGVGEIHVLTPPEEDTADAVSDRRPRGDALAGGSARREPRRGPVGAGRGQRAVYALSASRDGKSGYSRRRLHTTVPPRSGRASRRRRRRTVSRSRPRSRRSRLPCPPRHRRPRSAQRGTVRRGGLSPQQPTSTNSSRVSPTATRSRTRAK